MTAKKLADVDKLLGKWLLDSEGKRWRATCVLKGSLFGRLDGLECNEFTRIPTPYEVQK